METTRNLLLLPTLKKTRLHFDNTGLFLSKNLQLSSTINSIVEGRNIYIISDEFIKGGDYFYSPFQGEERILKCNNLVIPFSKDKKIILTTDIELIRDGVQAVKNDFLQWYINNQSCYSVDIEKEDLVLNPDKDFFYKIIIPDSNFCNNCNNDVCCCVEVQKPIQLRNPNLPAFPTEFSYGDEDFLGQPIINKKKYAGITKREYFTAKALEGFMAKHGAVDFSEDDAERIMKAVDMMLGKCKIN